MSSPPVTSTTTASSVAAGGLSEPKGVTAAGAKKLSVEGSPDWVAATPEGVWVAGAGDGIAWLDPASGALHRGVPVLSVCLAMDVGFGSVWAGSCSPPSLSRIDPKTKKVIATIPLPGSGLAEESSIGAGEGGVWALVETTPVKLVVVDPVHNRVRGAFPAPPLAGSVRAGLGAVWVTSGEAGGVVRLNPRTGKVVATIPTGAGPNFLALGPNAVWVMNQDDGTVTRVDPATNKAVATVKVAPAAIQGGDIAASGSSVWVRVNDEALAVRIDPTTNKVVERLGPRVGSGGVAIQPDAVWFSAHDVRTVWRLPQP